MGPFHAPAYVAAFLVPWIVRRIRAKIPRAWERYPMTTLRDDEIIKIATDAAKANNIPITGVSTSTTVDATGVSTLKISVQLPVGSTASVSGLPSATTTSQVIKTLVDNGEERLPLVIFEEKRATTAS